MKKIIRKREYDTENATVIKKHIVGYLGDPAGYEEILFQTPDGYYFLFLRGGAESPYGEGDIQILAKTKVKSWVESH